MLEKYFVAPKTLRRLRGGISGRTSTHLRMISNGADTHGQALLATFEEPPISAASYNEKVRLLRISISSFSMPSDAISVVADVLVSNAENQLSRPIRGETLLSAPRSIGSLPRSTSAESEHEPSTCDRLLRLVPNASWRKGTDTPPIRPRRHNSNPSSWREYRPMGC
jgi:hypothetical protein